jgi:hypothetical protein
MRLGIGAITAIEQLMWKGACMKSYLNVVLVLLATVTVGAPFAAHAEFAADHLFVVNEPSSGSAGNDFMVEFDPDGTLLSTLISQNQHIIGMRRVAFDAVSGHLFYSVSSWSDQIFEIREIDSSGALIETYTNFDFGSGNISFVFDRQGKLYIANDGTIFVKEAGESEIVRLFTLPYTGIGDLEIDSVGNLYLSDPFVNDTVYKIFPDGSVIAYVDSSDGIDNPYGLAVDENDNLYVANSSDANPAIVKVTPDGQPTVFASADVQAGILDMTFDDHQILYVSNRSQETIQTFDANGNAALFADSGDGLNYPSSMAFIVSKPSCNLDIEPDGDLDGTDLFDFANNFDSGCLAQFVGAYGSEP